MWEVALGVPGYKKRNTLKWIAFWVFSVPLLVGAVIAISENLAPQTSQAELGQASTPEPPADKVRNTPRGIVIAENYPDDWPWPDFKEGRVYCSTRLFGGVRRPVVLIELGGTKYALNGAALNLPEYPDSRELMGRTELGAYQGRSWTFIDIGLKLCGYS